MPHKRFRKTCHVFSVIDAEIAEKGHLGTETSYTSNMILASQPVNLGSTVIW